MKQSLNESKYFRVEVLVDLLHVDICNLHLILKKVDFAFDEPEGIFEFVLVILSVEGEEIAGVLHDAFQGLIDDSHFNLLVDFLFFDHG